MKKNGILLIMFALISALLLGCSPDAKMQAGKYGIKTVEENEKYYLEFYNVTNDNDEGFVCKYYAAGVKFESVAAIRAFLENPSNDENRPKDIDTENMYNCLSSQITTAGDTTLRAEITNPKKIRQPEFGAESKVSAIVFYGKNYSMSVDTAGKRTVVTVYDNTDGSYEYDYNQANENYSASRDKSDTVKETRVIDGAERECIAYKTTGLSGEALEFLCTRYTVEKNGYKAEVYRRIENGKDEKTHIYIADINGCNYIISLSNDGDALLSDIPDECYPVFSK